MSDSNKLAAYLATHDAPCPECGYNLRALGTDVCPECGHLLTLEMLTTAPKAKRNVMKICMTAGNIAPVTISTYFVWLFTIDMYGMDNVAAAAWATVLVAHFLFVWLLAIPIHRLILRSSAWIALFNPLNIVLLIFVVDSMLTDLIGLPLA